MFGKVLSLFFGNVNDIRRAGVAADLPDGRRIVVIEEAGVLLADMQLVLLSGRKLRSECGCYFLLLNVMSIYILVV